VITGRDNGDAPRAAKGIKQSRSGAATELERARVQQQLDITLLAAARAAIGGYPKSTGVDKNDDKELLPDDDIETPPGRRLENIERNRSLASLQSPFFSPIYRSARACNVVAKDGREIDHDSSSYGRRALDRSTMFS